jgi:autotransporter adhesin
MSHIHCADRARRHRVALFASCAFTAGALALSAAPVLAGCNSGDLNNTSALHGANCRAYASGSGATAVGNGAYASGINATALGASAGPTLGVAGATNVGTNSGYDGAGVYSTAVGGGTTNSTASRAQGSYSVAIGGGDGAVFTPEGRPSINLNGARASGYISMAFGVASQATGGGSSAFGLGSQASGDDSAAYGEFSTASGAGSVAIGLFSSASGISSVAFGRSAIANKTGAVAIGYNSVANVANTVSVGRPSLQRRIVYVATGVNPTDAVNLAQAQALATAAAASAVASVAPPSRTADNAGRGLDDMRRELTELRALLQQQQRRIAELEGSRTASAPAALD